MKKSQPPADPNATIQLDQVADLADVVLEDRPEPSVRGRVAPPPLPPNVAVPPVAMGAPPVAVGGMGFQVAQPASTNRRSALYLTLFLVLLVAAIGGGVKVGLALRGGAPSTPASAASVRAPSSAAPPSAASGAVITIPTIDVNDPAPSPSK